MLPPLARFLGRIEQALIILAVIATAIMMLLTSVDALLRYLFNRPIPAAYEITEKYLIVAAIFLGFSYAYRSGAFIRVTFLVDRLPPTARGVANSIAYVLSLACCMLLLLATGIQAWQAASDTTTLATVALLAGPAQVFVPIGFFLLLALMLLDIQRVWSGKALLFVQDGPES